MQVMNSRRQFLKNIVNSGGTTALFSALALGQSRQFDVLIPSGSQKSLPAQLPKDYAAGYESLKVGICQIYTEQWAFEDNLRRTMEAIETAAGKGAEIAITPECVLHGFARPAADMTKSQFHKKLRKVSEPLDGPTIKLIRKKAAELGIHILIGFSEFAADGKFYNTAAMVSDKGQIINAHRKVHFRKAMNIEYGGPYTPGETFSVAELKVNGRKFKAGTMICFDREVAESARCLRSLGAEIIFCPLATTTFGLQGHKETADNEMVTRVRAAENEVFIVVVNHASRYNGGSYIVGPKGEILCEMGQDAAVEVLSVPVQMVAKKYHSKPLGWMGWGYRRQTVYNKYLK